MKVIYVRFVTGDIQDCVPEWGISKSDLEMVRSHSHTLLGVLGIRDNWQNNFRDKG